MLYSRPLQPIAVVLILLFAGLTARPAIGHAPGFEPAEHIGNLPLASGPMWIVRRGDIQQSAATGNWQFAELMQNNKTEKNSSGLCASTNDERIKAAERRANAAETRARAAEKRANAAEERARAAEIRADAAEKRASTAITRAEKKRKAAPNRTNPNVPRKNNLRQREVIEETRRRLRELQTQQILENLGH